MKRIVPKPTPTGPKVWSQDNPRDQARVTLMAIEGDLFNLIEGIVGTNRTDKIVPRMLDRVSELKQILEQMPPGKWED